MRTKEDIEKDILLLKRKIEIVEGYSIHNGDLSFLYYQLRLLYDELKKVNEDEIYKGNGR